MKQLNLFLTAFFFFSYTASHAQGAAKSVNIDSLIGLMTIEEKAGQMTQIDLGVIAEGGICNLKNPQTLNLEKLKTAIAKYHIGSILNVGCGSGTIALDNWHKILAMVVAENKKNSRWKLSWKVRLLPQSKSVATA